MNSFHLFQLSEVRPRSAPDPNRVQFSAVRPLSAQQPIRARRSAQQPIRARLSAQRQTRTPRRSEAPPLSEEGRLLAGARASDRVPGLGETPRVDLDRSFFFIQKCSEYLMKKSSSLLVSLNKNSIFN